MSLVRGSRFSVNDPLTVRTNAELWGGCDTVTVCVEGVRENLTAIISLTAAVGCPGLMATADTSRGRAFRGGGGRATRGRESQMSRPCSSQVDEGAIYRAASWGVLAKRNQWRAPLPCLPQVDDVMVTWFGSSDILMGVATSALEWRNAPIILPPELCRVDGGGGGAGSFAMIQ